MCYIHVDIFLFQFELHDKEKKVRLTSLCLATETEFCCILFDSVQPLKIEFCCVLFDSVQPCNRDQ